MNQLRAIVVDDETAAQNVLRSLLLMSKSNVGVVAVCSDLPEAIEAIKRLKPNLVFLDVQMPNYAGYEIVNFFEEITFEIIFVTAYDHYAVKAFELNAIDYIVKPIDRHRLNEALEKMKSKLDQEEKLHKYQSLLESIHDKNPGNITISELNGGQVNKRVMRIKDIIAIEAKGAYCHIHLIDDSPLLVSRNLKYIESLFPSASPFFRSNRSWIINKRHVLEFKPRSGSIMMSDKIVAKISRNLVKAFEQELLKN